MVREVTDRLTGGGSPAVRAADLGEPWLPPDSPVREVHGDIAMLVGGLRALLLQSLHPVAMQAVSDHSGYRSDPWGRFRRTAAFIGATTYGSVDRAGEQIALVRRIHDRVTGQMPDGTPYRADDPELLMWIHVAEADSFLAANQAFARNPLPASRIDRYLADFARTAEALGVIDPPRTHDQLNRRVAGFRPLLRGSEPSQDAARLLLWDPPISGPARAGYRVLAAGAVATLPAWARSELGLPTVVIMDRVLLRPTARALMVTLDRAFEAEGFGRSAADVRS
ncbi:oxygenase MpaB family protein [Microlunatus endophyticus]